MGLFKKKSDPAATPAPAESAPPTLARRSAHRHSTIKSGRTIGEQRERLETANERLAARQKDKRRQRWRVAIVSAGFILLALAGGIVYFEFFYEDGEPQPTTVEEITYTPTVEVIDEDATATSGMKSSGKNLLIMVSISLAVAFLYFIITPLSLSNPTELLARTSPTFYDVLIALFGGFAGILEQCRKDKGTVFSGVAIATALMPPLCTAGYGLACGEISYFLGALYLFVINCTFIMLATYVGVKYFRFRPTEYQDEAIGKRTKRLTTALIIIFIIPSIWSAVLFIQRNNFEVNAISFSEHRSTYGKSILYDYRIDHKENTTLTLFFTGETLSERDKEELYSVAAEYNIGKEQIRIRDYSIEEKSDMNAFKDIYEKKESIISAKEQEIVLLKNELERIRNNELEYDKISKEIFSIKSSVHEVSITTGHSFNRDSLSGNAVISVVVDSADSISISELEELKQWLKIRLDTETIDVTQR